MAHNTFPVSLRRARLRAWPAVLRLIGLAALAGCAALAAGQTERVPMADGVKLATDVYLPSKGKAPYPTILIRTPYNKASMKGIAANLGPQGYAVVVQDMRGRFESEGHHAIIFGNDGLGGKHRDGHDTLRWIASQPWSNGKVVSWGASALGIVQNMAAPGAPEALKGQVVIMAFSDYYHQAAYQGGVWRKELLEGWLKATGMEEGNLETFLKHPTYDDFWKALSTDAHADQVNAPGVFIGGWHDIFVQGTINSFVNINRRGGPAARGKCFLVIGPQAHGTYTEAPEYPQATKAPLNLLAPMNVISRWLSGEAAAGEKIQPVHYYVMGPLDKPSGPGNHWRSADTWPPQARSARDYLHPEGKLSTAHPAGNHQLTFRYDPANPVPTRGGQNLQISKGPMDQRPVENRPDVLLFTSEPLAEPVEVTGRIRARLFVGSDCPDTDFTVKLTDVYPDGRSMLVTDGIRRASLRKSFSKPEPLKPGEVYELEVDLWSTSQVFDRGHRIRIAVSSSNAPRFEPNPNTGDPHPVAGRTRVANNTVYFSADRPSHIELPIYEGPDAASPKR
jgi:predicted acyl esterase